MIIEDQPYEKVYDRFLNLFYKFMSFNAPVGMIM